MLPSVVLLTLWIILLGYIATMHGKPIPKEQLRTKFSFWRALTTVFIYGSILLWGGFFNPLLTQLGFL